MADKSNEPLLSATWIPSPRMERLLQSDVASDQDFRNLCVAFTEEVAAGRLSAVKAGAVIELLGLVKDTLVGPQSTNVNIVQLLQQIESDYDRATHQAIDLEELNQAQAEIQAERREKPLPSHGRAAG